MTCEKHAKQPAKGYSECEGCEVERLQEIERLALAFAKAKGRHHSQHAMCDLLEHFGMPCVRPGEEQPPARQRRWPDWARRILEREYTR